MLKASAYFVDKPPRFSTVLPLYPGLLAYSCRTTLSAFGTKNRARQLCIVVSTSADPWHRSRDRKLLLSAKRQQNRDPKAGPLQGGSVSCLTMGEAVVPQDVSKRRVRHRLDYLRLDSRIHYWTLTSL